MLDLWNNFSLACGDLLFGWLLARSPSWTLVLVAVGTSLVLTLVRTFTTNQDLLHRVAADKRLLKTLLREAKQRRDAGAVARHRATLSRLAIKSLRAEGMPLLVSLLPIGVLATWCFQRLEFLPPNVDEEVRLVAYTPVSAIGEVLQLVPQDGLLSESWVQAVSEDTRDEPVRNGIANWTVRGRVPGELTLLVRYKDRTLRHELRVGQAVYPPSLLPHDDSLAWTTELQMRPMKLFGVVPGLGPNAFTWLASVPLIGQYGQATLNALVISPWLVGYLLITIPLVFVLKPLLRIC